MTDYVHRCMIVPAEFSEMARSLCVLLVSEGSANDMFQIALSPTAANPATHCGSSGPVEDSFAALLPLKSFDGGAEIFTPGQPEEILQLTNGAFTLEQISGLLDVMDVSDQQPFDAMARLGLQIIAAELP